MKGAVGSGEGELKDFSVEHERRHPHHHHRHHHHRKKGAPGGFGHGHVSATPWATSSQSTGDLGSYSSYSSLSTAYANARTRRPGALATLLRPLEEREIDRDPDARLFTYFMQ